MLYFILDAAQQPPADPKIGEARGKSHSSKEQSNNKKSSPSDRDKDVKFGGKTTPCINYTNEMVGGVRGPSATGLLTDWLNAFNFIIGKYRFSMHMHVTAGPRIAGSNPSSAA